MNITNELGKTLAYALSIHKNQINGEASVNALKSLSHTISIYSISKTTVVIDTCMNMYNYSLPNNYVSQSYFEIISYRYCDVTHNYGTDYRV